MALSDGVYKLVCAANPTGVQSYYDAQLGSRMVSWTLNESPGQVWVVVTLDGAQVLLDAPLDYTGYRISGGNAYEGAPVVLGKYGGSDYSSMRWTISEDGGTVEVNGCDCPTYTLKSEQGDWYLTSGAYGATGTVAAAQTDSETGLHVLAQRFAFVPAVRVDQSLTIPRGVTSTEGSSIQATTATVTPAFADLPGDWAAQCRYRTRTRKAGATALSEWSDWMELATGSKAGHGWGADPSTTAITLSESGGLHVLSKGVSVENSGTYDRTDVQFGIRQYVASWTSGNPFASASTDGVVVTARPLSLTALTATRDPDGIIYAGTVSGWHGTGSVSISSDYLDKVTASMWGGSFSVSVPIERHKSNPSGSFALSYSATDGDGISTSGSKPVTLSSDGASGMTISASASWSGTVATVTASSSPSADLRAWLVVEDSHGERYVSLGTGTSWALPAPLGKPWRVMLSGQSGSSWAVNGVTFEAHDVTPKACHVCAPDGSKDVAIAYGFGGSPSYSRSLTRSKSAKDAANRLRPVQSYTGETSESISVKGAAWTADAADVDWLAHASHVIFRDPEGLWTQAGVSSVDVERHAPDGDGSVYDVSAKLDAEVW